MKFLCVPLFNCRNANIDALDFSQQHLEDIPKEIYKVRKTLEELNLNVNKIEQLPLEFFRCFKLKKLDVSENKLKALPPEIGFLQLLMDLNISNNGKIKFKFKMCFFQSLLICQKSWVRVLTW